MKTLGSILTFAGAAALVASGVGAVAGSALFASAGGFSIAGISTSALLTASTALTAVGSIVSGLAGTGFKAEQTSTALKTERPPRVSAYGRLKLFGAYICYETASNGSAVDVWAYHDGRIDGIEGYYLADKKVTRTSSGYVQKGEGNTYGDSNIIQIGANLGLTPEVAHAPVVAAIPSEWTADHRGDGVVTGYMISKPVKAKSYQEVYPAGGPNQMPMAIVIRAQRVFDWRDPSQSVSNPDSWKWSENVILQIAHYQLTRNGKSWERHFAPTLDYWSAAADDADSPVPLKSGGSEPRYRSCVSHRHAANGSQHKVVLEALLSCCDGWMVPREDGALVIYSGRYYEPTVTVGPDQIASYTIEDGVADEEVINSLNVTYISDQHDFNEVDTDPWTDEDDILARGERSEDFKPQSPSHSQNRRLAKRAMAKKNAGKRGTFITTSDGGRELLSQRFINLRLIEGEGEEHEFAPYVGPAEITGLSRNLQTGAVSASWIAADPNIDAWNPATEEGNPAPVGDRIAREPLEAPSIISATPQYSAVGQTPEGDEPIDPTPGQTATGARVLIAADGPERTDITWYARWRVGTSGSWSEREYPDADPGPGVSFLTEFVPLLDDINVEVAYSVGDGRQSPWSEPVVVDTTAG